MSSDLGRTTPPRTDAHRAVLLALFAGASLAMAAAAVAGLTIGNPLLIDAAVALWIAAGTLFGVATAHAARAERENLGSGAAAEATERARRRLGVLKAVTGVGAILALAATFVARWPLRLPSPPVATAAVLLGIAAAALSATAARYFATVEPERLPEASGLARGARLLTWMLGIAVVAIALQWAGWSISVRLLHLLIVASEGIVGLELATASIPERPGFPTDLRTFTLFGSRAHPLGSALDAMEGQLGIDLRSTWALTVVRRSAEPLLIGLCVAAWLATALTVVAPDEQGLVEHFGVPRAGAPLGPGLHLHWPWPVDSVARFPVRRVQSLHIGHSGGEKPGPEDVLWARQHAKQEYTFLLGNGRDLIAIGAAVQFRIADPYAWRYHDRSPRRALRAIAYRAVMRETVSRTLAGTLSENVAVLTAQMRSMMQAEADELGLGVQITSFTIDGMHPPVPVAKAYQSVVSAEIGKTTAAVDARADRNLLVPKAEAEANAAESAARAGAAEALGKARGEAAAFQALDAAYRLAPASYRFRRRLEALEGRLDGRAFTVIDARIQRDGGELWLMR